MSTEMRLARLGLLHLVDDTEALKSALKEKAKSLRSNRYLQPADIHPASVIKNRANNRAEPIERD